MAEELDEPLEEAISKRDGCMIATRRCYNNIFFDLLSKHKNRILSLKITSAMLKTKSTRSLKDLIKIVKETHSDLTTLFGENLAGTMRLKEWLEMAQKANEENLTKHKALSSLRRFYPFENEINPVFYKEWGLEMIDASLKSDVGHWESNEQEPSPVQKKAPVKISQSYFMMRQ